MGLSLVIANRLVVETIGQLCQVWRVWACNSPAAARQVWKTSASVGELGLPRKPPNLFPKVKDLLTVSPFQKGRLVPWPAGLETMTRSWRTSSIRQTEVPRRKRSPRRRS